MNALLAFCAVMAAIYVPWDFAMKPVVRDDEVWFGVALHGWAAKAGEVADWVVYALGAWGLWHMRPWLPIGGALYMLQVAVAHLVWSRLSPRGHGILVGLAQAVLFTAIAVAFWRSRPYFRGAR